MAVARDPSGKQIWATLGAADVLEIDDARDRAREAIKRIRAGLEPFEAPPEKPNTFKAVAESYVERHVKARGLRSQTEIESILERQILPAWADRPFAEIRRGDAAEDREKGNGGVLVLPESALAIIRAQRRLGDNPYVFPGRGDGHFKGWSPCKRAFDQQWATRKSIEEAGGNPNAVEPLAPWTIHDLRRTARSLMSRAGVRPDVAERVMGHAITGVEGIYDRHTYQDEKADALRKLAALLERIVHPVDNVVPLEASQ